MLRLGLGFVVVTTVAFDAAVVVTREFFLIGSSSSEV